jgi:hypothetical protein
MILLKPITSEFMTNKIISRKTHGTTICEAIGVARRIFRSVAIRYESNRCRRKQIIHKYQQFDEIVAEIGIWDYLHEIIL